MKNQKVGYSRCSLMWMRQPRSCQKKATSTLERTTHLQAAQQAIRTRGRMKNGFQRAWRARPRSLAGSNIMGSMWHYHGPRPKGSMWPPGGKKFPSSRTVSGSLDPGLLPWVQVAAASPRWHLRSHQLVQYLSSSGLAAGQEPRMLRLPRRCGMRILPCQWRWAVFCGSSTRMAGREMGRRWRKDWLGLAAGQTTVWPTEGTTTLWWPRCTHRRRPSGMPTLPWGSSPLLPWGGRCGVRSPCGWLLRSRPWARTQKSPWGGCKASHNADRRTLWWDESGIRPSEASQDDTSGRSVDPTGRRASQEVARAEWLDHGVKDSGDPGDQASDWFTRGWAPATRSTHPIQSRCRSPDVCQHWQAGHTAHG